MPRSFSNVVDYTTLQSFTMSKPVSLQALFCFHLRHDPHYSNLTSFRILVLTTIQTLNPSSLQSRLTYLLKTWPTDAVRPSSVSVQSYIPSRLQPADKSTPAISESSTNALTALLNDRFARVYPLSPKLRRPASNPDHYDNVVREFAEAPNQDWFGRLKKRLAGIIRLS